MSARFAMASFAKFVFAIAGCALVFCSTPLASAQLNNNPATGLLTNRVVGGVKIDVGGVISSEKQIVDAKLLRVLEQSVQQADPDINAASQLRMISLRGLESAIQHARDAGTPLPLEVQFMAGLQRIEYIVLSPETNDIIIAGPGEGWKVDADGNIVGVNSNAPVIQLEDFLVAMRSAENARTGDGVSVSIDPTEQGVRQLQQLYKTIADQQISFNPNLQPAVEKAMGQHLISLTGVPEDSRFSQVLVAADYKLKRLSMGFEPAPIEGLPSFMELAANKNATIVRAAPRFWMECNYQPVAKTEDGSVWQIRGSGVKTLTEESHYDAKGKKKASKRSNRFASQWAELMTEKFDELAAAEPAFRELRNVMDMSVIAAIIRRENLAIKVGLETPAIMGVTDVIAIPTWTVPKSVPTQCNFVKLTDSWLVSASGGVMLDSWGVAEKTETVNELANVAHAMTAKSVDRWWWNASVN